MKKTSIQKLQLKKAVIAELNKGQMNQVAGAGTLLTCPCITEYPTHPCKPTIVATVCAVVDPTILA